MDFELVSVVELSRYDGVRDSLVEMHQRMYIFLAFGHTKNRSEYMVLKGAFANRSDCFL